MTATLGQVLAAVRSFRDERGYLPSGAGEWEKERRGDGRYPCWTTIRRAGFRSMSDLSDALGTWTEGAMWNRGRVIDGIRRYAADHGALPGSTAAYHQTVKGQSSLYPSFYQILKFFGSFEEAARLAGVPMIWNKGAKRDWTADEDDFLRAFVGTVTVAELQRAIGRHSSWGIDRRLYDLGLTQRTGQGRWTMLRTANAMGLRVNRLDHWVNRGAVPSQRESHFVFLNPGELPDFLLLQGNTELREAALLQRRQLVGAWVDARARMLA